jgi:hypothetical protein
LYVSEWSENYATIGKSVTYCFHGDFKYIYAGLVHNCHRVKKTSNICECNMVHIYNEILFNCDEKGKIDACYLGEYYFQ